MARGLLAWKATAPLVLLSLVLVFSLAIALSTENHPEEDAAFVFSAGNHEAQRQQQRQMRATGGLRRRRYLLYEVNHSEGFNLRRDVYMRMANLVFRLRRLSHGPHDDDDWVLVLPPWGHLYHWKSRELGHQIQIPWAQFFELESLNKHVPVMEFQEYLKESEFVDLVYYLQYFEDTFKAGSEWTEKYEESAACIESPMYYSDENRRLKGWFWGYGNVYAVNFTCLSLQGPASTIVPLLISKNESSIMLDRAETLLHDSFGDAIYWKARRSMRFAKKLRATGDAFRRKFLNSTDLTDGTELAEDWTKAKTSVSVGKGGPYLGVHLRREDFLHGRAKHLPSLAKAAAKIKTELSRLNLTLVYVATDAPQKEFDELESHLVEWGGKCLRFLPSAEEKMQLGDGGVAVIDQWIASHARYFIGTYESTFTFRIQEEREILGFHPDATFNRFCGDEETPCEAPSRWRITY